MTALRGIGQAVVQLWQQGYAMIWANIAFVVLSLPLVTSPAAYSALMRVAYASFTEPHEADLQLFWETFKANLGRALAWGVGIAAFGIVNFTNLFTAIQHPPTEVLWVVLSGVYLLSGVLWGCVMLYTWPIYYSMAQPSLLTATQQALLLSVRYPFLTWVNVVFVMITAAISMKFLALWLLLTWGLAALVGCVAVLNTRRATTPHITLK